MPWTLANSLKIVHFNDVYQLSNLASMRSLIDATKRQDETIVTLAGDFLSPSLLASIDQGRSMVETLKSLPVDYVSLGNHDADHGVESLLRAAQDFAPRTVVVNSNLPLEGRMARAAVYRGQDGTRYGIAGLCSTDDRLYLRGAFGDGVLEKAVNVTRGALSMLDYFDDHNVDVALLMTHQDLDDDVALADRIQRDDIFPKRPVVILGGHDHDAFAYDNGRCKVVKSGSDAKAAYVLDILQDQVSFVDATTYPEEPTVKAVVERHGHRVERLGRTVLRAIETSHRVGEPLSSRGARFKQTTMGSLCCTAIRKALRADVALLNAGCLRGDKDYYDDATKEEPFFTFADLATELPFETEIVAIDVPGYVLKLAFHYSRRHQRGTGGFFQHDNGVETTSDDTAGVFFRTVAGEPFDAGQTYSVALPWYTLHGMDGNRPLLEWVFDQDKMPPLDAAIPAKHLCLQVYHREIWRALGDFANIDRNRSGCVDFYELKAAIKRRFKVQPTDDLVKDCLLAFDLEEDFRVIEDEYDACMLALDQGSYSTDTAKRILSQRRRSEE